MIIINADDLGRNKISTDNSLICFKNNRITSASAMVFMADSQRAAELALENGLNTGLHLNFTLKFDGDSISSKLLERQQCIVSFLRRSKYRPIFYNPFLKRDFEYVYNAQYEDYVRLYNKIPSHIDGHHHMHLCTNMIIDRLISEGSKVRRSFTFSAGEKMFLNRFYRNIVDSLLKSRYTCTDLFFCFSQNQSTERLLYIVMLAKYQIVEVMVHPERKKEFECLMSNEYFNLISLVQTGNYSML